MISIAICDDDNDFRLLLRDAVYKMIESHGEDADIEDFSDGQTCLSQLGSRKFNILFLDIEMPGMDGFSMAGKMQKSYPNIVLISSLPMKAWFSSHMNTIHSGLCVRVR